MNKIEMIDSTAKALPTLKRISSWTVYTNVIYNNQKVDTTSLFLTGYLLIYLSLCSLSSVTSYHCGLSPLFVVLGSRRRCDLIFNGVTRGFRGRLLTTEDTHSFDGLRPLSR